MQLRYVETTKEFVRLLETFGRLTSAAHHDVNTNKGIGHHRLDAMYFVGKQLAVVMAVHQLQHRIAAALQRNMVMRHEGTTRCAVINEFVTQQVGLQRTDTIALNTLNSVQGLHQVHKAFACCLAKVTDVHACQHYFLAALACSLFSLCHQRGYRRITTEATSVRNRTIGAEIITAVLNLQEVARTIAARTAGRKGFDILRLLRIVSGNLIVCHIHRG